MIKNSRWTEELTSHEYFNSGKMKIILPVKELKKLPIKEIDKMDWYEVSCQVTFNPLPMYAEKLPIYRGEVGHDLEFRYVVKEFKK